MIAEMISKIKGGQLLSLTTNEKEKLVEILEKEHQRKLDNTDLDTRVRTLVKKEFNKMSFSKKESNRAILTNRCQEIIYKQWGFSNDYLWKLVDESVEELIPENMD